MVIIIDSLLSIKNYLKFNSALIKKINPSPLDYQISLVMLSPPQFTESSGAFTLSGTGYDLSSSGLRRDKVIANFDASLVNAVYSKSNTVQPNAIAVQYLIKC